MTLQSVLRRPHGKLPYPVLALIGLATAAVTAQAWSNKDRVATVWQVALVVGTLAAITGLLLLFTHRYRPAGVALCAGALLMPTGFGFVLSVLLLAVAIPLLGMKPPPRA